VHAPAKVNLAKWRGILVLLSLIAPVAAANGQTPCSPRPEEAIPIFGAVVAQQRQHDCQAYLYQQQLQAQAIAEQQRAGREAAERAQQAQWQREQEAQERRRQSVERARQAAEDRAAETIAAHERAVAEAKAEAESSPDNFCRIPTTAKALIDGYNDLFSQNFPERKVVDIEHLVTLKKDSERKTLACHGVWVLTTGERVEGTLTFRPNVAGDLIQSWKAEGWEPTVLPSSPPQAPRTQTAANNGASGETAFQTGLADRSAWEAWYGGLSGDYRNGATFWASQRSLPHHASCDDLGGQAMDGCRAAVARLSPSDVERKRDPEYRKGWNSYQPPS